MGGTGSGASLWSQPLRGGSHWSGVMRRGFTLRLVAGGADANVAALFYSREQPLERYNMADTLKAQHTAHLTTGCVCYSDMGRILCAITADTVGWHDPLCGLTDPAMQQVVHGALGTAARALQPRKPVEGAGEEGVALLGVEEEQQRQGGDRQ